MSNETSFTPMEPAELDSRIRYIKELMSAYDKGFRFTRSLENLMIQANDVREKMSEVGKDLENQRREMAVQITKQFADDPHKLFHYFHQILR